MRLTKRRCATAALAVGVAALAFSPVWLPSSRAQAPAVRSTIEASGRIDRDPYGVPHITAADDAGAMRLLGFVHAQDRLFQMDYLRRTASGTSAELLGNAALASDIQLRTIGIRRAAEISLAAYPSETRALIEAYAEGVNAYLNSPEFALPPEYPALELTRSSIPEWTALDTVTIAKGVTFQLSFDQLELVLTPALAAYQQTGIAGGFDGTVLFFKDVFRVAPFDPTVSIPPGNVTPSSRMPARSAAGTNYLDSARRLSDAVSPATLRLAEEYVAKLREVPMLRHTVDPSAPRPGSNWFVVGGRLTESGFPMIANDPHLTLSAPPVFYEVHLTVTNDPARGPMNVAGVTFVGGPGIAQGCNDRICWGTTNSPMDVTDVYRERILLTLGIIPRATVFEGREEPLILIPQSYRMNLRGNGVVDDVVAASVGPLEGGVTVIVPRRNNGPIVAVDTSDPQEITGLSIQYAGFGPTRELDATLGFARARNLEEFRQALQFFDAGSQNFGYADVDGNIAYLIGGELPLREDLETLGRVDGVPPFFIRDGTHGFRNEWLPVENGQPGQAVKSEILPFAEMPQLVNPAQGFIVNTNQDPIGLTLDNNPLNEKRPSGGIYYLNPGFAGGFRQGRLVGLIRDVQAKGEKMSLGIMAGIQASNQMLDAQVFIPHILSAWRNAQTPGAPSPLAELARDRDVAEAVARLRIWDFSTPTGIQEGWDPGDEAGSMPGLTHDHVQNSIAATIYSVWRGQVLRNTIDAVLARVGLDRVLPPDDQSLAGLRVLLESWPERRGRGFSGVDFFEVAGVTSREAARDTLLLRSVRQALDLLAADAFAPAFNSSRLQDDYRWGKLHRVVFSHPAGAGFSIPAVGGFAHLGPALRGIPRSGGFQTVDASTHSARAASADAFMFSSGPARRFVGEMTPSGPRAFQVIPGGQNGNPAGPQYAGSLALWLGNRFHPLMTPAGSPQQTFRAVMKKGVQ